MTLVELVTAYGAARHNAGAYLARNATAKARAEQTRADALLTQIAQEIGTMQRAKARGVRGTREIRGGT